MSHALSGSKAQTLDLVRCNGLIFEVPDFLIFEAAFCVLDRDEVIKQSCEHFSGKMLAIRSSACGEDGVLSSAAGKYETVLHVDSSKPVEVGAAIDAVIKSYQSDSETAVLGEIIVQEMIHNTVMSGVIFTHDLNTGAPYYVINYDDQSGMTNTVTSGEGEYANRTIYIHRGALSLLRSPRFRKLMSAVVELEQFIASEFLDIEFAIDNRGLPYLFQVRSITTQPNWNRAVSCKINAELDGIQAFLARHFRRQFGVLGQTTVLGQMPDWNPAEMIGRAPRALASSLYRTLITRHAWRDARARMGYSVPIGQELMIFLGGQPFIDVRRSFHSFLPSRLPKSIGEKLVDSWLARLRSHPELHDKIEFEVAITAFTFDIDKKINLIESEVLSEPERQIFREAVRDLTVRLVQGEDRGSIESALSQIRSLASSELPTVSSDLSSLFPLIENCIRLGTEPFAVLARHAFIASGLLKSLVSLNVLTAEEEETLRGNVRTVASDLVDDMRALQANELSYEVFMERYGHLRPGTYDILSLRYDQMPHFASSQGGIKTKRIRAKAFQLSSSKRKAIEKLLVEEGFKNVGCDEFFAYCTGAIAAREYGKFVFTKSISTMLELVAKFGESHGLSREEMSHVPIDYLINVALNSDSDSIEETLRSISCTESERHALSNAIRLPQVLFDQAGVHIVPFQVSQPNFITSSKVTGEIIFLDVHDTSSSIEGRIVLIENADPGYDWIFAHRILGLVTKYGGINSHMAIRCAEFGIPAAIGCGEQRFEALIHASRISIDCSAGLISPLH